MPGKSFSLLHVLWEVAMKLYSGPLSLFSKKVEIALAEKGLAVERIAVPFTQVAGYSPKHPAVTEANPKGQVPVLVDGDLVLYDSTVIVEYLEDAYPSSLLWPRDPVARARARLLELFADEVMIIPLRNLMHRTEPGPNDSGRKAAAEAQAPAAAAQIAAQHGRLDALLRASGRTGETADAADIASFLATLWGLRLGGPGLDANPWLASWYEKLKSRPAFSKAFDEIRSADRELSALIPGGRV